MYVPTRPTTASSSSSQKQLINSIGKRLYGRRLVKGPEMRSRMESTKDENAKKDIIARYDRMDNARVLIKQAFKTREQDCDPAQLLNNVEPATRKIIAEAAKDSRAMQMNAKADTVMDILARMDQLSTKPIFHVKSRTLPNIKEKRLKTKKLTFDLRYQSPLQKRRASVLSRQNIRNIDQIIENAANLSRSKSQRQYVGNVMKQMEEVYGEKMKEITKGLQGFNSSSLVIEDEFIANYSQWDPNGGIITKERLRAERQAARKRRRLISQN